MERRKIEREDGSVTLLVTGPSGAVTLDAWPGQPGHRGIIGIHRVPGAEWNDRVTACEYLEGGVCDPDAAFGAGERLAPLAFSDEEAAWAEVEDWYRAQMGEN